VRIGRPPKKLASICCPCRWSSQRSCCYQVRRTELVKYHLPSWLPSRAVAHREVSGLYEFCHVVVSYIVNHLIISYMNLGSYINLYKSESKNAVLTNLVLASCVHVTLLLLLLTDLLPNSKSSHLYIIYYSVHYLLSTSNGTLFTKSFLRLQPKLPKVWLYLHLSTLSHFLSLSVPLSCFPS
jgi:hypothetical protein